jgi:hypothetical protein
MHLFPLPGIETLVQEVEAVGPVGWALPPVAPAPIRPSAAMAATAISRRAGNFMAFLRFCRFQKQNRT